ncbi:hypothetical protein OAR19_00425, partial [bacterium]|nr:hypothetical protein [bacterium]
LTANPVVTINVLEINGVENIPTVERTVSISVAETVYFSHKIINRSNVTDNITWNILAINGSWDYEYILDDNNDGVHQGGETTVITQPVTLSSQASYNFFLKFDPILADSVSSGITVITNGGNVVKYTGYNSVDYGGIETEGISDNIDATAVPRSGLNITAYFEGYYDYAENSQELITINIQFRTAQNIDSGVSYNIALDVSGNASFRKNDLVTGNYYICVRQYIEGLSLGVNHVGYVSSESITITQDILTTVNISNSLEVTSYLEPFVSQKTGLSSMTELHSMYQVKGADSNADQKVNIIDIIAWENQAKDPNADENSDGNWTEKANYNGDTLINGQDFSIWSKNKSQYIPLPEDD